MKKFKNLIVGRLCYMYICGYKCGTETMAEFVSRNRAYVVHSARLLDKYLYKTEVTSQEN